jgi:ribosomal protein S24E
MLIVMKLEVRNENYNRLLKRKEVDIFIDHTAESTPSMAVVQELLARQIGSEADKTEIKEIFTARGSPWSNCLAFVWDEKVIVKAEEKKAE